MKFQALIFDIDGVLTDGKKYTDGTTREIKSLSYKDLDAIHDLKNEGYLVGCISGENTLFSRAIGEFLDYSSLGTKDKRRTLEEFCASFDIKAESVCYMGDGKYDIDALKYAGLSVCPKDAVAEVQKICDIILDSPGGMGCVAELYTRLHRTEASAPQMPLENARLLDTIEQRLETHQEIVFQIQKDNKLLQTINMVCDKIIQSYQHNGQLFLCGNGGSAADAQHLAAELVGRFYLERQAYPAEALSTNTSILTSLANDYDYNMIFARQIEAKGRAGDVLIGITTSGKSQNILQALKTCKKRNIVTVLMSGKLDSSLPVIDYADYIIEIPSRDTPRIQETHILIGHIICEIVESKLTEENENES